MGLIRTGYPSKRLSFLIWYGMQKTRSKEVMRIRNLIATPLARLLCTAHSSSKLFVAGLSYDTNETVLRDTFGQHGEIIEVKVICDHVTGKSKGYGFVRQQSPRTLLSPSQRILVLTSESAAVTSRKQMHSQMLDGRRIRVSYAHKL